MTDTTAQEFNFDAFMYGVRRDSPFDGSTLADSISDDEVRRAESAFNSLLKRAEEAEKSNAFLKEQLAQLANFNPDWDMLEACRESWREVVALLKEREAELAALKGDQEPVAFDADIIRDANRYRFLRDEDAWGEDSDSWDVETRTGLISSENLMGGLSPDHFDAAIDARMAASDIPFLNPVTAPKKPAVVSKDVIGKAHDKMWECSSLSVSDETMCKIITAAIEAAGGIVKDGE